MIKAYSKKEAYEAVRALRDGKPERVDLDRLVHFFAPTRTRNVKSVEQWVALAVGVRDVRTPLNYLYVKDGTAWGTDGHRAHWGATELADGYYDPRTLDPAPFSDPYPDVARATSWIDKDSPEVAAGEHKVIGPGLSTINYGGTHIDAKYVADAQPVGDTLRIDPGKGAHGTSAWGRFAIMACRI